MRFLSPLRELLVICLLGGTGASYASRQVMVDITNDFGICILQAVSSRRENAAFSPYGLVSVGVVLYEGSRGPTAAEIHNTLKLPWDRQVTRLGFRDLHRHLKSYFTNDGFLRGLVLSKPNVRLRTSYLKLLRFYGFYTNLEPTTTAMPATSEAPEKTEITTTAITATTRIETMAPTTSTVSTIPTTTTETTNQETTKAVETGSTTTDKLEMTTISMTNPPTTTTKEPETQDIFSASVTNTPEITSTGVTSIETETTTVGPATTAVSDTSPPKTTTVLSTSPPEEMPSTLQALTNMGQLVSETSTGGITTESTLPTTNTDRAETESLVVMLTEIPQEMPEILAQIDTTGENDGGMTVNTDSEMDTTSTTTETDFRMTPFEVSIVKTTVNSSFTTFDPNLGTTETTFSTKFTSSGSSDSTSTSIPETETEDVSTQQETTKTEDDFTRTTSASGQDNVFEAVPNPEDESSESSTNVVATTKEESTVSEDQGPSTVTTDSSTENEQATTLLDTSDLETADNAVSHGSNESLPTRMPRSLDALRLGPEHREGNVANWILRGQGPHWSFTIPTDQWFFTFNGGESVPVLTYTAYLPFAFLPDINALALQLPLDDPRYSMLILLPEERLALEALLESLTWCSLTAILAALKTTAVYAVIPSFTTVKHINLGPPLAQLGVRSLFDPFRADLREMSPEKHVFVRTIEQVVTVSLRKYYHNHRWFDATPNDVQQHFVANHPFAYFVLDKETNVALMAGTIVNPITKQPY